MKSIFHNNGYGGGDTAYILYKVIIRKQHERQWYISKNYTKCSVNNIKCLKQIINSYKSNLYFRIATAGLTLMLRRVQYNILRFKTHEYWCLCNLIHNDLKTPTVRGIIKRIIPQALSENQTLLFNNWPISNPRTEKYG